EVLRDGRQGGGAELEPVEVGDGAAGAVGVHDQAEDVLSGGDGERAAGNGLVGWPGTRVGDGDGTGDICAVEVDVEGAAGGLSAGDAEVDAVGRGGSDIDGVVEPLTGRGVGEIVSAVDVAGGGDADAGVAVNEA